jgi:hypothetical protein
MNATYLALLVIVQLGDSVTPVSLEEFYKENGRRPLLRIGTEMRVGDLGILPYGHEPAKRNSFVVTKVLQVLSADSELLTVDVYGYVLGSDIRFGYTSQKLQHIRSATIMVKGISTRGLADDDGVQLSGWWSVDGTESYDSAAGKRTVMVIRPFRNETTAAIDADVSKKAEDEKNAPARAEAAAKEADAKATEERDAAKKAEESQRKQAYLRTWKTKDGKFSVLAYFVDVAGGEVTLERQSDGKVITVSTSLLSPSDIDQARVFKLKMSGKK